MKILEQNSHESKDVMAARKFLEANGYKVEKADTASNDTSLKNEGIFGIKSKAEKAKEYNKLIQEVLKTNAQRITMELSEIVEEICSKVAVDDTSLKDKQKSIEISMITPFINEVKKSPENIFNLMYSLANKHGFASLFADDIKEYRDMFTLLQKEGDKRGKNLGYNARQYLIKKVGELIIPYLQKIEKSIKNR